MKKVLVVCFFSFLSLVVHCQYDSYESSMIAKIDSIAQADNITECEIHVYKAESEIDVVQRRGTFKFDGPFLMVGNAFYNISKLLHFKVMTKKDKSEKGVKKEKKTFIFVFQNL